MDKNTLLTVCALVISPFVGAYIQAYFNKRKNTAEVQNLNISGEISIGDAWKDYAKNQEQINKLLRDEFKELQTNFVNLTKEIILKDKKIQELESRIESLEKDIEGHQNNR